jgi:hypothetical protein
VTSAAEQQARYLRYRDKGHPAGKSKRGRGRRSKGISPLVPLAILLLLGVAIQLLVM